MWRNDASRRVGFDPRGEMRELREHLRRGADQQLRGPPGVALQLAYLAFLERLDHEQGVDEKTIAPRCRNASRGRMRARDESHLFEVGHHVADRRRRQLEPGLPRQHPRPDRLPVGDVALDQRLQKVLRAGVQHAAYFML